MIKITMIFGEDAVRKYDESKELPSEEWLMDNGGVCLLYTSPSPRDCS